MAEEAKKAELSIEEVLASTSIADVYQAAKQFDRESLFFRFVWQQCLSKARKFAKYRFLQAERCLQQD